jgi:plastocyanin
MVIGVLVGVLALAAAGCGGDGDDGGSASATTATPETTSTTPATTAAGGGGENELKLAAANTAWDTDSLAMTAGAEVTVEISNADSIEHNFTFAEAGADQDIEGGEDATVTLTAPAAGEYPFLCKYHPQAMKGTVTVT